MHSTELVLSPRLRKTAFEDRVFDLGIQSFTIYNHMTLPVSFSSNPDAYQHLCEHVQVWDVAAERQVEVVGPDALELVELITPCLLYTSPSPRDLSTSRMPSSA